MSAVAESTVYRTATVRATQGCDSPPTHELASLVCEIAERLEEMEGVKFGSAGDLVIQLGGIAGTSRRAFNVTVQLLHGNMSEALATYQEQADKRGVTKQDIHYEFTQEVGKLKAHYPQLFACIQQIRAQASSHEDPETQPEARADT